MTLDHHTIQMMFPDEPEWKSIVDEGVLVNLVRDYVMEQSCASSAIYELSRRNHPDTASLTEWMLLEQDTGKFLKRAAAGILLEHDFERGLNCLSNFADQCEIGLLAEIIDKAICHFQNTNYQPLRSHPTIELVEKRLRNGVESQIQDARLFYERIGKPA